MFVLARRLGYQSDIALEIIALPEINDHLDVKSALLTFGFENSLAAQSAVWPLYDQVARVLYFRMVGDPGTLASTRQPESP